MATADPWLEFDQIRHNIKNNTVDRLKQILSGLNDECGTHFSKSGKKQDIIDRIVATLDTWRAANMEDKWIKAKGVVYQVRNHGIYTYNRLPAAPALPPVTTLSHNSYVPVTIAKTAGYLPTVPGSSTIGRYDPYAPPRKANVSSAPVASSSSAPKPPGIRFKESPFFRVDQAVSPVMECPESTSPTDRRQQTVTFTLNSDQIMKLKTSSSTYQLRLYCTSSVFYSGGATTFRTNTVSCPIEFPPTCEVRVNGVQLSANLKGLKKKPGTAPPPDLGKYARLTNLQNRVEMVYVNGQQPVQSKKYYLVVMLVEATGVEQLVGNLKSASYRSSSDIQQKMVETMTEDDDIVAGPQKMSLKCPLSFMRVTTPCRSSKCVHPQCFDATSWFSVMEQTTTWLCPVCERILDCKDLIIDGYFDEILKQSPESVEDVIVEADGEWHTSDNKYGSTTWKSQYPTTAFKSSVTPRKSVPAMQIPSRADSKPIDGKAKVNNSEIVVLDSDDEDEGRVKRELSPSFGSRSSISANQSYDGSSTTLVPQMSHIENVIDLTLDSDDEEPPVSKQAGKRKASDAGLTSSSPTEPIWKKGRLDPDRALAASAIRSVSSNTASGTDYTRSANSNSTSRALPAPSSSPIRYAPPYPSVPLSPVYTTYRGGSSSSPPQPPLLPHNLTNPYSRGRWA